MAEEDMRKTRDALEKLGPIAVETLEKVLSGSQVPPSRVGTAKDVLSRLGFAPKGLVTSGDSDES